MNTTGQCLCMSVRFTLDLPEGKAVAACHCKMCQRWTGSAFLALATAPDAITFEGEENIQTYASSDWAERSFCRKCGSGLFYRVTAPGKHHGKRYVSVGLLDDPGELSLAVEVFYDRKSSAFEFAGNTTKKTEADVMAEFAGG